MSSNYRLGPESRTRRTKVSVIRTEKQRDRVINFRTEPKYTGELELVN